MRQTAFFHSILVKKPMHLQAGKARHGFPLQYPVVNR